MPDSFVSFFSVESFGWRDAADILLVAVLVYATIALLRRTRGAAVGLGVLVFILLWRLAVALQLETLGTILDVALTALPIAIVLLFQNTIRRALMALGQNPLMRFFAPQEGEALFDTVSLAAISFASTRTGALMVVEREVGLRTYVDSGVALDARPSYELLLALFHSKSPLHDGAVIIAQGRVAAASCLLPLTGKPHLSTSYGSRHRAALGLSEETDAVVVVVSEERGTISLVHDGEIRAVQGKELRDALAQALAPVQRPEPPTRVGKRVPA